MEKYKENTINSYNVHSQHYCEKFKKAIGFDQRNDISAFLTNIPGNNILDIGCGDGTYAKHFESMGFNLTCIDLSEEMVAICKKKKLNAEILDLENIQHLSETYDGIWASASIIHIKKESMKRVIRNCYDKLCEKGILYVSLKEGQGEIVITDNLNGERFFGYWKKEEFTELITNKFKVLYYEKRKPTSSVFLNFVLQKKE